MSEPITGFTIVVVPVSIPCPVPRLNEDFPLSFPVVIVVVEPNENTPAFPSSFPVLSQYLYTLLPQTDPIPRELSRLSYWSALHKRNILTLALTL